MGRDIYEASLRAREVFSAADQALGFSLSTLCFQGPDDALQLTENTQPAVLTVSIALAGLLEEKGLRPDYVAGHSLGEYSALVCGGALSLEEAVRIVRNRGRYMQEAVPVGKGAMAAILGLTAPAVAEACAGITEGTVSPANFNAPEQTVIAGEAEAVRRASEAAKQKGAKRVLLLPVSAPFHCELMAPARDRLAEDLRGVEFHDLSVPLVTNADAQIIRKGELARDALIRQVCAPVRWVESIELLARQGVDRFVEVGPGKVLSGLVKKILPQVQALNVEDIQGIEALASAKSSVTM